MNGMEITQADVEKSTRDLSASMDNLFETAMEIKAQRDELLAVVREYCADNERVPPGLENTLLRRARAAIAKASGA